MARAARARRYAQAVFDIARDEGELDRWLGDLRVAADALRDADLLLLLESRRIPIGERLRLGSARLTEISPLARNLVFLLASKGRLDIFNDIVEEYTHLYNAHQGIAEVAVKTAIPLNEEEVSELRQGLARALGMQVILTTEVDPQLLGGLVARIGDRLVDGSVRCKLDALKRSVAGTTT